jgi:hypothetical protein
MCLIREQSFRLGEDFDTTDEQSRPVLHVDAKVLSLRNRLGRVCNVDGTGG